MSKMKVSFLDVGHGDFIYAETPLGDNLVIDVGSGNVIPSDFLKNVSSISELQISHPHTDHFDDIVAFSKKTIKSFRCPSLDLFDDEVIGWKKSDNGKIAKLRALRKTIPAANEAVKVGEGFQHMVYIPDNIDYQNPNTASMVTVLAYKGVKILFGGDLPASGWEKLLKKQEFVSAISDIDIFKVPHHGRQEGCCEALFKLKSFNPRLCVISDKPLDKDNKNTAATSWYTNQVQTGCSVETSADKRKVLTTRSDGSIFIEVNEDGIWRVYPNTKWRRE